MIRILLLPRIHMPRVWDCNVLPRLIDVLGNFSAFYAAAAAVVGYETFGNVLVWPARGEHAAQPFMPAEEFPLQDTKQAQDRYNPERLVALSHKKHCRFTSYHRALKQNHANGRMESVEKREERKQSREDMIVITRGGTR